MAPAAVASVDQTSEMLEKMNLEAQAKASSGSDDVKKQGNGVVMPYEQSTTPIMDQSMCYPVNGYQYYYGGYDSIPQEWAEYMRFLNPEGVEVPAGVYGENGLLMYPHPYGYAPYPYSPATSPGPDGAKQYQYSASNYSSLTSNGAPFTPNSTIARQGDVNEAAADQNGGLKLNNKQIPTKPINSYTAAKVAIENGRASVTYNQDSVNTTSRNQILRPQSHLMSRPMSGNGANNGFMNRIFSNQVHPGYGYIQSGYDSRIGGRGWLPMDAKYRPRGRGNGFYGYGNENADGLNELNRGPRAKRNFKVFSTLSKELIEPAKTAIVEEKEKVSDSLHAEQYNLPSFAVDYSDAKFFIIKSYSEDDVHKSIKYNVWASTPNGNKKLDAAYQHAQEKSGSCPVFLFFSVNASGQFVGLAEMASSVDFDKILEFWQQDKWNGCFSLKWHIVKDVPNSLLKHIILENNENKPVTNSRDTQEVKLEQGLQMLKIFKDHSSKTSILDDFTFYEARQKAIQEKKVRLQFQKQVWEGKSNDMKSQQNEANGGHPIFNPSKTVPVVQSSGGAKIDGNGSVAKTGDGPILA